MFNHPKRYETRDAVGGYVCRILYLPVEYVQEILDHLNDLALPSLWDEVGDIDVETTVDMMQSVIDDMAVRRCVLTIGDVYQTARSSLPSWALACDGATYNRVDYPDLYAALDAVYIVDADTFTVPDLRDRVPVGSGSSYGVGDEGGEADHTLTVSEMPSHNHSYEYHIHATGLDVEGAGVPDLSSSPPLPAFFPTTGNKGGDQPHNNMQPYHALRFAIIASEPMP